MKPGPGYLAAFLLASALAGGAAGEIIARFLPEGSHASLLLTSSIGPSVAPREIDLVLASFTFGAVIRLNLTALLASAAALVSLARRL